MRAVAILALLALTTLLLSGCTGNSVTVSGQGATSGSQSRTLQCGVTGTGPATGYLAYGEQGAGQMHVKVTDGKGASIHDQDTGYTAGQGGQSVTLKGEPGTWTLSVSTGFGYAGQWGVTLSC